MEKRWVWPFELLDKIGEGGMGEVYRARYVGNNRRVAVKLLPLNAAENKTLLARFEREMDVLKQLDHPNIVRCFGGTCESKQQFYAMELVEGGTLSQLIHLKGRLSWETAVDYAMQMCDALQYAHNHGVIHRDIKPSNFLVSKTGHLKLSDFGLITVATGRRLTATGRTLGTVEYMSPEQIRGNPLSNRSDLYALGCVIYEMLTGQPPFLGDNQPEIMHKHLKDPIPHASRKHIDIPLELDTLICDLLAKSADARPESADVVKQRLQDILQPGRRVVAVEPTLIPTRSSMPTSVVPLKGVKNSSDSISFLPVASDSRSRVAWEWGLSIAMMVFCLIGWGGWKAAESRMLTAENALVEQMTQPDPTSQLFAINTLAKFSTLHSGTIAKLQAATKDGSEQVKVAALGALARHATESRGVRWEIYKLQRDSEVSSNVRNHAEQTFNVLNETSGRSLLQSLMSWGTYLIVIAVIVVGGWFAWQRIRSQLEFA